jgi:hypothetical protein
MPILYGAFNTIDHRAIDRWLRHANTIKYLPTGPKHEPKSCVTCKRSVNAALDYHEQQCRERQERSMKEKNCSSWLHLLDTFVAQYLTSESLQNEHRCI